MRFLLLALALVAAVAAYTTTAPYSLASAMNGGWLVSNNDPRPASAMPGNVGLCFSGGGSRALSAAWGQMRALNELGLLTQAKALSSVSGGSWATVPYTYLPASISDADFLGPFVSNPADLYLTATFNPLANPNGRLDVIQSSVGLGAAIANQAFSMLDLVAEGVDLFTNHNIPASRLWTHMVGEHILGTFGLSDFDATTGLPVNFFCANQAQCSSIQSANPQFQGYNMQRPLRPFHIVNAAMFVTVPSLHSPAAFAQYLAPVQFTPYYSGVISTPPGANTLTTGNQVGGGGVQSYAFDSTLSQTGLNSAGNVVLNQNSPFALSDITGTSSSFFAEVLENQIATQVPAVTDLNPAYNYFSVADATQGVSGNERFSDGGTLDNSGVLGMLVYEDVDSIVVFINTNQPLQLSPSGDVMLADCIAPLFGYQPYAAGVGYQPYPSTTAVWSATGASDAFRFNQVFESSQFQAVQQGLHAATTNNGASPISTAPCVFLQSGLTVLPNQWWGITGSNQRTVNVLWVYNQDASQFRNQLDFTVNAALALTDFPWYPTVNTGLDAVHVNMLAHFSSWVVMQHSSLFQQLFTAPASSDGSDAGDADADAASMIAVEGGGDGVQNVKTWARDHLTTTVLLVFTIFALFVAALFVIKRHRRASYERMEGVTMVSLDHLESNTYAD